jgi:hypothetical protein
MTLKRSLLAVLIGAAGMLTACASRPYYGYRVGPPPPVPAYRAYGVAPGPGYVWCEGFYDLRGSSWVWSPGRWARPPRPHARWEPARWERRGHDWRYRSGHWR